MSELFGGEPLGPFHPRHPKKSLRARGELVLKFLHAHDPYNLYHLYLRTTPTTPKKILKFPKFFRPLAAVLKISKNFSLDSPGGIDVYSTHK